MSSWTSIKRFSKVMNYAPVTFQEALGWWLFFCLIRCTRAVFVPGCCLEVQEARWACVRADARGPPACGWVLSSGRGRGPGAAGRGAPSFEASPCRCWVPGVRTLRVHKLVHATLLLTRSRSSRYRMWGTYLFKSSYRLITHVPQ